MSSTIGILPFWIPSFIVASCTEKDYTTSSNNTTSNDASNNDCIYGYVMWALITLLVILFIYCCFLPGPLPDNPMLEFQVNSLAVTSMKVYNVSDDYYSIVRNQKHIMADLDFDVTLKTKDEKLMYYNTMQVSLEYQHDEEFLSSTVLEPFYLLGDHRHLQFGMQINDDSQLQNKVVDSIFQDLWGQNVVQFALKAQGHFLRWRGYFQTCGISVVCDDIKEACYFHRRYESSNSSTYTKNGTPCDIIYGTTTNLTGFLSQDNVEVGGLLVKNQIFLETTATESLVLVHVKFDGVVGLAFPDNSDGNASPIWHMMAEQGLLRKKIFSIWFNMDQEAELGGEIVFGGVDADHFKGKHTYVPVTSQKGIWQIEIGEFFIGNYSSGYCQEGCTAVLDSGSPLLSGPTAVVIEINHAIGEKGVKSLECKEVVSQYGETIYELLASGVNPDKICSQLSLCFINGAQHLRNDLKTVLERENRKELLSVADDLLCSACQMTAIWVQNQMNQGKSNKETLSYISKLCHNFPAPEGDVEVLCDDIAVMPNLTLTIGNKPFAFTPQQYIRATEEENRKVCRSQFYAVDLSSPPSAWIFGNVFMGVYHTVFDFGNQRVGFAEAV